MIASLKFLSGAAYSRPSAYLRLRPDLQVYVSKGLYCTPGSRMPLHLSHSDNVWCRAIVVKLDTTDGLRPLHMCLPDVCTYVCLYVCMYVRMYVCKNEHTLVSMYLPIYLPICLSIYLSICLSLCLSTYRHACTHTYMMCT